MVLRKKNIKTVSLGKEPIAEMKDQLQNTEIATKCHIYNITKATKYTWTVFVKEYNKPYTNP